MAGRVNCIMLEVGGRGCYDVGKCGQGISKGPEKGNCVMMLAGGRGGDDVGGGGWGWEEYQRPSVVSTVISSC